MSTREAIPSDQEMGPLKTLGIVLGELCAYFAVGVVVVRLFVRWGKEPFKSASELGETGVASAVLAWGVFLIYFVLSTVGSRAFRALGRIATPAEQRTARGSNG